MHIFVTGGAGYIGSAVATQLLAAGHQVTIYDSLVTGHRAALPAAAHFIQADLADRSALQAALAAQPYEAVLHFAGFIEAGESMQNPGKYFDNNVSASFALLQAAQQAGVKRFVFSSTAAVYRSSDTPLSEASPLGPENAYGQTKLMVEEALEWNRRAHGMHFAALRYFNAAGAMPGHGEGHQPESHLIPLILQVALGQREQIAIYGEDYATPDGTCIRDYIHLQDLAAAHLLALDALGARDRMIYNIGSGEGFSVRQVIEMARQVTGHPIPAIHSPRRPGDAARLVASPARIQSELGWKAVHSSLESIVGSAWAWHQSHPHGYEE
jgi:UDP-glucose 4-epimerase